MIINRCSLDRCLSCHETIGERRADGVGYHGTHLAGECSGCHADHRAELIDFDRDAFNHRLAAFPLVGRHEELRCEACHQRAVEGGPPPARFAFLGLAHGRCTDCHTDPHEGSLSAGDCTGCHDPHGWKAPNVRFDHRTAAFPLDAVHDAVACASCHATSVFRPTPTGCAECHAAAADALQGRAPLAEAGGRWEASPHAGRVRCDQCHDTSTADPPLTGYAERCASCHTARYAELFLERTAHLGSLQTRARTALRERPDADAEARLAAALAVGHHDYVPAEASLRGLVEELERR